MLVIAVAAWLVLLIWCLFLCSLRDREASDECPSSSDGEHDVGWDGRCTWCGNSLDT